MELLVRFERTRGFLRLAYKASAIGHQATGAYQGRVLIGSTRNPTSTSEALHPSPPMLFILPYQRSPTATPFHGCTSTVAHLSRPNGVFATFATVTIPHYLRNLPTSSCPAHCQTRWSRTTRRAVNRVKLFCAIYFYQADSCHPRTPTSQGIGKRRRGVFLRTISNWQKVNRAIRAKLYPPIHPIYIAPLCSALAPQWRHIQLLTHAGPGPLGVSGESAHCGCTGTDHRFRRFYVTNLTGNFQWFAMLRSSQTFRFRPNHQMASLPSRTDALLPELFLCLTSLIGLSSQGCSYQPPLGQGCCKSIHTTRFTEYFFRRVSLVIGVLSVWKCRPNPRYGASSGSRTHTICLEGRSTSRYTIPAFYHFSCVSYIYIILKFSRKVKFSFAIGGKWVNRTPENRATTCRFTTRLTTHLEQVTGIGPVSQPWQGRIITAILYLHIQGTSTDLNRLDLSISEIV